MLYLGALSLKFDSADLGSCRFWFRSEFASCYWCRVNRTVLEYTRLLSRAFNGAIEVDGMRIVAHPSGTLIARSKTPAQSPALAPVPRREIVDPENDWSQV